MKARILLGLCLFLGAPVLLHAQLFDDEVFTPEAAPRRLTFGLKALYQYIDNDVPDLVNRDSTSLSAAQRSTAINGDESGGGFALGIGAEYALGQPDLPWAGIFLSIVYSGSETLFECNDCRAGKESGMVSERVEMFQSLLAAEFGMRLYLPSTPFSLGVGAVLSAEVHTSLHYSRSVAPPGAPELARVVSHGPRTIPRQRNLNGFTFLNAAAHIRFNGWTLIPTAEYLLALGDISHAFSWKVRSFRLGLGLAIQ